MPDEKPAATTAPETAPAPTASEVAPTASDPGHDFKVTPPPEPEAKPAVGAVESDRFAVAHVPDDVERTPDDRVENLEETVPGYRRDETAPAEGDGDAETAPARPAPFYAGLGWGRDVKPNSTAQKPTREQADAADEHRARFAEKHGDAETIPGTAERAAAAYEKANPDAFKADADK